MSSIINSLILIILYFIPFIIAKTRKHNKTGSIFLANLLFGWTLIGWAAALVWSVSTDVAPLGEISNKDLKKHLPEIKCPFCGSMNMANTTICHACGKDQSVMAGSARLNSATKIVSYARKDPSAGISGLQGKPSKKYKSQININNN
ncbi:superinfection immunity protein [Yersinia kristensenii]|uniref:superinfection immunity protein n=1 Tax=Yersinia kristensenii TaxID=28152 RepID=UPI001C60CBB1|nr:superinfection immunity protein [Yersinia kristensenii]MBW5813623.1 superinfection immunity protein [Yersinia kristensenii]MBW5816335.1 superinfection immunity protein [Yersinia kristensenii]MBW5828090.1 superinfection immunity protein [Yersinia kristensenii]MBW5840865.1 superinfection immunity protein [Yersinia kristensenii]